MSPSSRIQAEKMQWKSNVFRGKIYCIIFQSGPRLFKANSVKKILKWYKNSPRSLEVSLRELLCLQENCVPVTTITELTRGKLPGSFSSHLEAFFSRMRFWGCLFPCEGNLKGLLLFTFLCKWDGVSVTTHSDILTSLYLRLDLLRN